MPFSLCPSSFSVMNQAPGRRTHPSRNVQGNVDNVFQLYPVACISVLLYLIRGVRRLSFASHPLRFSALIARVSTELATKRTRSDATSRRATDIAEPGGAHAQQGILQPCFLCLAPQRSGTKHGWCFNLVIRLILRSVGDGSHLCLATNIANHCLILVSSDCRRRFGEVLQDGIDQSLTAINGQELTTKS
jgi:hypothetical protein